jgi:hypothetical protein
MGCSAAPLEESVLMEGPHGQGSRSWLRLCCATWAVAETFHRFARRGKVAAGMAGRVQALWWCRGTESEAHGYWPVAEKG